MKLIIIFILTGSVLSINIIDRKISNECYKTKRSGRIVGGHNAIINDLPFMVSLNKRGSHVCGSSILNEKWLITAAHCLCNGFNEIMRVNTLKGIVGLHKRTEFEAQTEYNSLNKPFQIDFDMFITYPDYQCTDIANDIALLKLSKPIILSERIQPVCLDISDENEQTHEGLLATVSGWGWTNEDFYIGNPADTLQSADVKIWSNDECKKSFEIKDKSINITESQLCAGYKEGGIDSCWADSGGPLVINDILVGVVSTGLGCARKNSPGIYTRINKYVNWIETAISDNNALDKKIISKL